MTLLQLCLCLLLAAPAPAHDYHISKTNVRYVADRQEIQVEMHLFVDDLEADLASSGVDETLEIGTEIEHPAAGDYLARYLSKHFQVEWNGTALPFEILGYELEDDLHGLWVYLVSPAAAAAETVTVTSTLMYNTYPDQKNIVKLFNGRERSATLLLSKERPSATY